MNNHFSPTISLFIADDHQATICGLLNWLSQKNDLNIVGTSVNADQAVSICKDSPPDIVLLDLHMPGELSAADRIKAFRKAGSKVIIFSGDDRPYIVKLVLKQGASAFLSKCESFDSVYQVIRNVAFGSMGIVSSGLLTPSKLTGIDEEILDMMARGLKYEDIASARKTSAHTVRKQCDRIQIKVGVESRERLIIWAVNSGFGIQV